MHPEVLVAGMPNSGTSFMTELVVKATSLSPGPAEGLKKGDKHNRHGYWEYLPLRNYIWQHTTDGTFSEREIPSSPLPYREAEAKWIASIAEAANVQVFKCFKLPWMYSWFGGPRKAVLIMRNPLTLYNRYYKAAGWELNEYRATHARYYDLAAKHLEAEWNVKWVDYEAFSRDLEAAILDVCIFLNCSPLPQVLREIWRPRC